MTSDERRVMWQARIESFKASGESSVTAWCVKIISVFKVCILGSKKIGRKTDTARTAPQWVSFDTLASKAVMPTQLTLAIGVMSIQIEEGFNPTLLREVLQVLQTHVK